MIDDGHICTFENVGLILTSSLALPDIFSEEKETFRNFPWHRINPINSNSNFCFRTCQFSVPNILFTIFKNSMSSKVETIRELQKLLFVSTSRHTTCQIRCFRCGVNVKFFLKIVHLRTRQWQYQISSLRLRQCESNKTRNNFFINGSHVKQLHNIKINRIEQQWYDLIKLNGLLYVSLCSFISLYFCSCVQCDTRLSVSNNQRIHFSNSTIGTTHDVT